MSDTIHTYTVVVMATHRVRETYVIQSALSYKYVLEDLNRDAFKLYDGGNARMVESDFVECQDLSLLDLEETPDAA